MEVSSTGAAAPKLGEDNLCNRMLQKMGWKEGLGQGMSNQGGTDIINVQNRAAKFGLGTVSKSKPKKAAKKGNKKK